MEKHSRLGPVASRKHTLAYVYMNYYIFFFYNFFSFPLFDQNKEWGEKREGQRKSVCLCVYATIPEKTRTLRLMRLRVSLSLSLSFSYYFIASAAIHERMVPTYFRKSVAVQRTPAWRVDSGPAERHCILLSYTRGGACPMPRVVIARSSVPTGAHRFETERGSEII